MCKQKVCIITNAKKFKGGITAVVSGYHGSRLEQDCSVHYVESCSDSANKFHKVCKMLLGYVQFLMQLLFFRPQIVHVHASFGFSFYRKIYYIYLGKLFGAKIVNHIHGAQWDSFYVDASDRKKALIKKVYNHCDCLIALSEEWKDNLKSVVPEEKIVVVENYSILHRSSAKKDWKRTVLFLGEVGRRKGCCDIPAVAGQVKAAIPDCRFVVAGNILPNDFPLIKEKITQNGVEDSISFPGWVRGKEKDDLLNQADLFFLPSYNEGMPMSILDAMGYALPIVSTTVGGIPKTVKNGVNGYLCQPGDVDGFAARIVEILQAPAKCESFGNASVQIVQESYSLDAHIRKIESVYNLVTNKNTEKGNGTQTQYRNGEQV